MTDFVAADGSNNVAVSAEVADLDELGAMLGSPQPETVALMEKHGVVQPITLYVES